MVDSARQAVTHDSDEDEYNARQRRRLRASIPMPDDWYGERHQLIIPEGLTDEMLDKAEPLIRAFMDHEEAYGESLAILLFEIFRNGLGGKSPSQDRS